PDQFFPAHFPHVLVHAGDIAEFWNQSCNTNNLAGQLVTTITGPARYISPDAGALTPSNVSGNVITYNISDWKAINPNTDFNIVIQTDTTAQAGQQVCIAVSLTPTAGDRNAANNSLTQCYTVVNSFDPNDKQVSPIGNIDTAQHWLTYTVRFQNTGTT